MIRMRVSEGSYVVGQHASERLDERGIMEWQAVIGVEDGELIAERPDATPNPAVEVRESLPDGASVQGCSVSSPSERRRQVGNRPLL